MSEDLLKILSLYGYITAIQDYLKYRIQRVEKSYDNPIMNLGEGHFISIIAYDRNDQPYLVITVFSKDDYILNRLNQVIDALRLIVEKSLSKQ
jgi:hypothetical protein